eukprot:m.146973 g.146973  ORF g.146973 m.146973 type:complete len:64 (+) comp30511_c0_seq1:1172-1363(+)
MKIMVYSVTLPDATVCHDGFRPSDTSSMLLLTSLNEKFSTGWAANKSIHHAKFQHCFTSLWKC